jgi:hypothetical protein
VRGAFRVWDESETDEKRKYVRQLVANAAGAPLSSDDVVILFVDWLRKYSLFHFGVITAIFKQPGITKRQIWESMRGSVPPDNSAEADLFKFLFNDLTIGEVARYERQSNAYGEYLKVDRATVRGSAPSTLKTPFDDTKGCELTELGKQFVHYTMNESVARLEQSTSPVPSAASAELLPTPTSSSPTPTQPSPSTTPPPE